MNGKKDMDCLCEECREWVKDIEKAYEVIMTACEQHDLQPTATFFAVISIMASMKRNGHIPEADAFDVTGFFMKRFADCDYFLQTESGLMREH